MKRLKFAVRCNLKHSLYPHLHTYPDKACKPFCCSIQQRNIFKSETIKFTVFDFAHKIADSSGHMLRLVLHCNCFRGLFVLIPVPSDLLCLINTVAHIQNTHAMQSSKEQSELKLRCFLAFVSPEETPVAWISQNDDCGCNSNTLAQLEIQLFVLLPAHSRDLICNQIDWPCGNQCKSCQMNGKISCRIIDKETHTCTGLQQSWRYTFTDDKGVDLSVVCTNWGYHRLCLWQHDIPSSNHYDHSQQMFFVARTLDDAWRLHSLHCFKQ